MLESLNLAQEYSMENNSHTQRGFYFEEFEVGQKFKTAARTVTETDIVSFAGLSADYNSIHTDADFAKSTPFGQRVAHGLLVISIVSGLANRSGFIEGTVLAFREIKRWKFSRPVFIGDTVHAEIEVIALKALPRLGGGALDLEFKVKNQDGEIAMKGIWNALVQSKPE
jgi:acyl dehydratase